MKNTKEQFPQLDNYEKEVSSTQSIPVDFLKNDEEEVPMEIKQKVGGQAERIKQVREDLVRGSDGYKTHRREIFQHLPRVVTAESSGNRPLLKKWLSIGLAALGLSGESKLEAQTNDVDAIARQGSDTNIVQNTESSTNAPAPKVFVYEEQQNIGHWKTTTPATIEAAKERLQGKRSSVFGNTAETQTYTPSFGGIQQPSRRVEGKIGGTNPNVVNRNRPPNYNQPSTPLIQINRHPPTPRSSNETIVSDGKGGYQRIIGLNKQVK